MKFEIYKDKRGEWRWRLKARNGKILAVSSESYIDRVGVHRCITLVMSAGKNTSCKLLDFP